MSDFKNKAYSALQTALTTELNTLADGSNVLDGAIDLSDATHSRLTKIDFEVYLGSVDLSAQTNPAIYIWLLKRTDGTNFEDGSASVDPPRPPDAVVPLREFNGVQRVSATAFVDTPDQAKILYGNRTGAALAATLNTLKYYIHTKTVE